MSEIAEKAREEELFKAKELAVLKDAEVKQLLEFLRELRTDILCGTGLRTMTDVELSAVRSVERAIAESQVQAEPSILGLCRTCGETVTHGNHSPSLAGHYFVAELGDGEPSPEPEPVCPMCCKPVFTDRAEGDTRELKAVREALWQLMRCVELGYKGKPLEDAMAAAEKLLG